MHYIPPDSFYPTDEYKTKKMVFRKIDGGDGIKYRIGFNETISGRFTFPKNSPHDVAVPQNFYIAIFATTKGQWRRIMGDSTADNGTPVCDTSYNTIRGSAGAAATPSTGIIANLNAKTQANGFDLGAGFDLPTESMWEIAARAGTTTRNHWGDDLSAATFGKYAVYVGNASSLQKVGTKEPNQWGIYDMIGNAWNYCRDVGRTASTDLATLTEQAGNALKPRTTGRAGYIVIRGGGYYDQTNTDRPDTWTSGAWVEWTGSSGSSGAGFRLAYFK